MSLNEEIKQIITEATKIYSEEGPEAYAARAGDFADSADDLLDEKISEIKNEMSTVPSDEAIKAISLLNMCGSDIKDTAEVLLSRFGDNILAANTIYSICLKNGISTERPKNSSFNQLERLKILIRDYLLLYPVTTINIATEIDTIIFD